MMPKEKRLVLVDSILEMRTTKKLEDFANAIWPLLSDSTPPGEVKGIKKAGWSSTLLQAPSQQDDINCGTCLCLNVELLLRKLCFDDIDYATSEEFMDRVRMLIISRLLSLNDPSERLVQGKESSSDPYS